MKIRIKNWNIFERENKIYFTRDINISNVVNVYGIVCKKRNIYFLSLVDFYTWKAIALIKNTSNIEIIDYDINNMNYFAMNKQYLYEDSKDNETVIEKYDWIISQKWMIEHGCFFAAINCDRKMAMDIFLKNHN